MENWFEVIGKVIGYAIAAIAAIAMTRIKWRSRVDIVGLLTRSETTNDSSNNHPAAPASSTVRQKGLASHIGLAAILLASLNQAFLTFGPSASRPLTVGDTTSIAQSVCLLLLGAWLLARG